MRQTIALHLKKVNVADLMLSSVHRATDASWAHVVARGERADETSHQHDNLHKISLRDP
jgi:hypothetical protein